jgi:hypothetical protein
MNQDELYAAVALSIAGLKRERDLWGYVLCTDDDVSTLGCVACTREWAEANPSRRWIPACWDDWSGTPVLERFNDELCDRSMGANGEAFERHIETAFEELTAVLARVRADGLVAPNTLLAVLVPDPGPAAQELAARSIDALNEEATARGWKSELGLQFDSVE